MDKTYDATYRTKRCASEDALLAHLLGQIKSEQTLDLACGTGHFHPYLPGKITGLDKDPEMLAGCKSGAELFLGSFADFPQDIKSQKYNLVTNLFGVFGDTTCVIEMLKQSNAVLESGGGLFLVAYGMGRKDTGFARDILARWGEYIPFIAKNTREVFQNIVGYDVEYCFGMSATVLDWLSLLPQPVYDLVFKVYHQLRLPDILPFKYFRAHYVVILARKR